MSLYYDRQGNPIPDVLAWAKMFEGQSYRVVRQTAPWSMRSLCLVSTVWLGLDHRFGFEGPPLIFETMVFIHGEEADMERYSTEEIALKEHQRLVRRWAWRCLPVWVYCAGWVPFVDRAWKPFWRWAKFV